MSNQHQFGSAVESTYGTAVTVERFQEILSEGLSLEKIPIVSEGIRPGVALKYGSGRNIVRRSAGGPLAFEVSKTKIGRLFEHAFGTVVTANPLAAAYTHTFTFGDLAGLSLTLQKGVEDDSGTVRPFTYTGCKIARFSLENTVDQLLKLSVDVDAQDEDEVTALATASYTAPSLLHFAHGSVEIADAAIAKVKGFKLDVDNGLDGGAVYLGNAGLKAEPKTSDYRTVSGTMTIKFANLTDFYNAFDADTALKVEFIYQDGVEIETGYESGVHITMLDVRLNGETPKISGIEVPEVTLPFEAFQPAAGEALELVYTTTDATP